MDPVAFRAESSSGWRPPGSSWAARGGGADAEKAAFAAPSLCLVRFPWLQVFRMRACPHRTCARTSRFALHPFPVFAPTIRSLSRTGSRPAGSCRRRAFANGTGRAHRPTGPDKNRSVCDRPRTAGPSGPALYASPALAFSTRSGLCRTTIPAAGNSIDPLQGCRFCRRETHGEDPQMPGLPQATLW